MKVYTSWNLAILWLGLLCAFLAAGYEVLVVAPYDNY